MRAQRRATSVFLKKLYLMNRVQWSQTMISKTMTRQMWPHRRRFPVLQRESQSQQPVTHLWTYHGRLRWLQRFVLITTRSQCGVRVKWYSSWTAPHFCFRWILVRSRQCDHRDQWSDQCHHHRPDSLHQLPDHDHPRHQEQQHRRHGTRVSCHPVHWPRLQDSTQWGSTVIGHWDVVFLRNILPKSCSQAL